MAITKPAKPAPTEAQIAKFMAGAPTGMEAPDAAAEKKPRTFVRKGNKVQFSHLMTEPELLAIEQFGASVGLTRTAIINLACKQLLSLGIVMTGKETA